MPASGPQAAAAAPAASAPPSASAAADAGSAGPDAAASASPSASAAHADGASPDARPAGIAHERLLAAPRHVLLFSGHRIDAPGRVPPRLPPAKTGAAAAAIAAALAALEAGPADRAYTQGSSGGDLLFAEACLARGVPLVFLQPLAEAVFVEESVRSAAAGDDWVRRYDAVREHLAAPPRTLADTPGDPTRNVFERCNRWLLESALAWGEERVRFVCLWDGEMSGGPGGTADLVAAVRRLQLSWVWLDARRL